MEAPVSTLPQDGGHQIRLARHRSACPPPLHDHHSPFTIPASLLLSCRPLVPKNVHSPLFLPEGTICPISFVKDTLLGCPYPDRHPNPPSPPPFGANPGPQFPYALKALPDVLAAKWDDVDFLPYRDAFPAEVRHSREVLQAHVEDLTRRDVKIASLKNLQGYLWEEGYRSGAYATPLFPDVVPRLKQWRESGLELAIYSSGSVFAQKLLFAHVDGSSLLLGQKHHETDHATSTEERREDAGPAIKRIKVSGDASHQDIQKPDVVAAQVRQHAKANVKEKPIEDLTEMFGGWFDTTNAGPKADSTSYNKILAAMNWQPSRTLFLSDNTKEVDAAAIASVHAILVERPGNQPVPEYERQRLEVIGSLDELSLPDWKGDREGKHIQWSTATEDAAKEEAKRSDKKVVTA
nr:enolase-phosphatase e1 [Quercus suber]